MHDNSSRFLLNDAWYDSFVEFMKMQIFYLIA